MRPHRSSQFAQQRSRPGRQRGQNYGDHARSHNYDGEAVGSSSMRGWHHEYSDTNHHRRYSSGEHVAGSHSEWQNSGSARSDGNQAWHTTYDHYRDGRDYTSHYNNHYEQRHYTRYNSPRNQHSRSYHSSAHRSNDDYSNILFRHRGSHRAPPPKLNIPPREPMQNLGPSKEYLKTSLEKSETVARGTKANADVEGFIRKLLVLDLNGTLVYRSPHRPWRDRNPGRSGGGTVVTKEDVYAQFDPTKPRPLRTVHPRPYLTSFRNYLFHPRTKKWLDTMVWSSAQPHSVGDMVEKCFGERRTELVAIWARDRLGLDANEYGRKVQTTKDLDKPWIELNSMPLDSSTADSSSPPKRDHSAMTTLLLDDSPLKAHLQPYNHLCLKEYDLELRKHDMSVRELELANEKLASVISGKQTVEAFLERHKTSDEIGALAAPELENTNPSADPAESQEDEAGTTRKRKRKEKKENKKKERIEQQLQKLQESSISTYDNTLLAVIGILDAVKKETNVAAWIRSGGLIQSLLASDHNAADREPSVNSPASSAEAVTSIESPRKKLKISGREADKEGQSFGEAEGDSVSSVNSDQLPPLTSSPIRAHSPRPAEEASDVDRETERTGVPVDEPVTGKNAEGEKDVQEKLWFNHPGTEDYWAERGRQVLRELEIDIVPGVIGSTG